MSGKIIRNISFEAWIAHIFDHPVADPQWYWNLDADEIQIDPMVLLKYTADLFNNSEELLRGFSDAQVNQGLWFLIGEATSDLGILNDDSLSLDPRICCIRSINQIFEQCLAKRCSPHLSHLDEIGAGPLNSICYMWWDIFPSWGYPEKSSLRSVDEACIEVMEKTLKLPSIAVQESAIHGLSHWGISYPERCNTILQRFAESNSQMRPELSNYVSDALRQAVQ